MIDLKKLKLRRLELMDFDKINFESLNYDECKALIGNMKKLEKDYLMEKIWYIIDKGASIRKINENEWIESHYTNDKGEMVNVRTKNPNYITNHLDLDAPIYKLLLEDSVCVKVMNDDLSNFNDIFGQGLGL